MPNKIIEEFRKEFGDKKYTASYQAWDLDPEKVEAFILKAIQSAKKEAVEELIKEIEIIISKEKTMYWSDNPIIQTGLDNVMEQFKMKLIDKVKQKAKELLK